VTAILYQTGCLLQNPIYRPFIHKSKQEAKIIMCVKAKICNARACKSTDDCTQLWTVTKGQIPTHTHTHTLQIP